MTPERLAEIKARAEAATAGPWAHDGDGDIWSTAKPETREQFGGGWSICTSSAWRGENDPDIAFIANARQDIPDLVAEVELLRCAIDELDDAKDTVAHYSWCREVIQEVRTWQKGEYGNYVPRKRVKNGAKETTPSRGSK